MKPIKNPTPVQKLRLAAIVWVAGLHSPIVGARDSGFVKLDRRLQKAAIRFGLSK